MVAVSANRKVLLTGASGFLGSHVLEVLLRGGYDVCATVRSQQKAKQVSLRYLPHSIAHPTTTHITAPQTSPHHKHHRTQTSRTQISTHNHHRIQTSPTHITTHHTSPHLTHHHTSHITTPHTSLHSPHLHTLTTPTHTHHTYTHSPHLHTFPHLHIPHPHHTSPITSHTYITLLTLLDTHNTKTNLIL
jgi:NAD dependent epimerase/dehydratase family